MLRAGPGGQQLDLGLADGRIAFDRTVAVVKGRAGSGWPTL